MDELCTIGNILWEESSGENFDEHRYIEYVRHIMGCIVCQRGLDISEHDVDILNRFYNKKR